MDGSRQLGGEGGGGELGDRDNLTYTFSSVTALSKKNNNINTIPKFYFLLVIYTFLLDPLNFLPVS